MRTALGSAACGRCRKRRRSKRREADDDRCDQPHRGAREWDQFRSLQTRRSTVPAGKRAREVVEHVATQQAATVAPNLHEIVESGSPEERLDRLSAYLHRELCSILGLDPARALDPARGFAQMGLDSLMAIDLRNRLQKALGRPLPSPVVFNYPSIRALATYLAGIVPAPVAATPDLPATLAGRPLAADEITDLSDEEAEALLAAHVATLGRDGA